MSGWFNWGGNSTTPETPSPTPPTQPLASPSKPSLKSGQMPDNFLSSNDSEITHQQLQTLLGDQNLSQTVSELRELGIDFSDVPGFDSYLQDIANGGSGSLGRAGKGGQDPRATLDSLFDGARGSLSKDVEREMERKEATRNQRGSGATQKAIEEEAKRRTDDFARRIDEAVQTYRPDAVKFEDDDTEHDVMYKKTQKMFDLDRKQWQDDLSEDELDKEMNQFVSRLDQGEDVLSLIDEYSSKHNKSRGGARTGGKNQNNSAKFEKNGSSRDYTDDDSEGQNGQNSHRYRSQTRDPDFESKSGISSYRQKRSTDSDERGRWNDNQDSSPLTRKHNFLNNSRESDQFRSGSYGNDTDGDYSDGGRAGDSRFGSRRGREDSRDYPSDRNSSANDRYRDNRRYDDRRDGRGGRYDDYDYNDRRDDYDYDRSRDSRRDRRYNDEDRRERRYDDEDDRYDDRNRYNNKNDSRNNNSSRSSSNRFSDRAANEDYANDLRRELEYHQDPDPENPFQRKREARSKEHPTAAFLDRILGSAHVTPEQEEQWAKELIDLDRKLADKGYIYPEGEDSLDRFMEDIANLSKPSTKVDDIYSDDELEDMRARGVDDPEDNWRINSLVANINQQLGANPLDSSAPLDSFQLTASEKAALDKTNEEIRAKSKEKEEWAKIGSLPSDFFPMDPQWTPTPTPEQMEAQLRSYDHLSDEELARIDRDLLKRRYEEHITTDIFDSMAAATNRKESFTNFDKASSVRMRTMIDQDKGSEQSLEKLRERMIEVDLENQDLQALENFKQGKYTRNPDGTLVSENDVIDMSKYYVSKDAVDANLRGRLPEQLEQEASGLLDSQLPPALRSTAPPAIKRDDELALIQKKLKDLEEKNEFFEEVVAGKKTLQGSKYDKNNKNVDFDENGIPIAKKAIVESIESKPITPNDFKTPDFDRNRDRSRREHMAKRIEAEEKRKLEWEEEERKKKRQQQEQKAPASRTPQEESHRMSQIDKLNAAKEEIEIRKWREKQEWNQKHEKDESFQNVQKNAQKPETGAEKYRRDVLKQYFDDDDNGDVNSNDSASSGGAQIAQNTQQAQKTQKEGQKGPNSYSNIPSQPTPRSYLRSDLDSVISLDDPSIVNATQAERDAHLKSLTEDWDPARDKRRVFGKNESNDDYLLQRESAQDQREFDRGSDRRVGARDAARYEAEQRKMKQPVKEKKKKSLSPNDFGIKVKRDLDNIDSLIANDDDLVDLEELDDPESLFGELQKDMEMLQLQNQQQEALLEAQIAQAEIDNKKSQKQLDIELDNETLMIKYVQEREEQRKRDKLLSQKFENRLDIIKEDKRAKYYDNLKHPPTRNDIKQMEAHLNDEVAGLDLSVLTDEDHSDVNSVIPSVAYPPEKIQQARELIRKQVEEQYEGQSAANSGTFSTLTAVFGNVAQPRVSKEDRFLDQRSRGTTYSGDKHAYESVNVFKQHGEGETRKQLLERSPLETIVWSMLYAESSAYFDINSDFSDRYSWVTRQLKVNKVPKNQIDKQTIRRYSLAYDSYLRRSGMMMPPRQLRQKYQLFFEIPAEHRDPSYYVPTTNITAVMPIRIDHGATKILEAADDDDYEPTPENLQEKRYTKTTKTTIYAPLPQFTYSTPRPRVPLNFISPISTFDILLDPQERVNKDRHERDQAGLKQKNPNYKPEPYRRYDPITNSYCTEKYYRTAMPSAISWLIKHYQMQHGKGNESTTLEDLEHLLTLSDRELLTYTSTVIDSEYDQYDEKGRLVSLYDFQSTNGLGNNPFESMDLSTDPNNPDAFTQSQLKEIFGDVDPLSLTEEELDRYIDNFVRLQAVQAEISQIRSRQNIAEYSPEDRQFLEDTLHQLDHKSEMSEETRRKIEAETGQKPGLLANDMDLDSLDDELRRILTRIAKAPVDPMTPQEAKDALKQFGIDYDQNTAI